MATRIIGSRRIVVDGTAYRWRIRRRATASQTGYGSGVLHVTVQLAEQPGAVLILVTDHAHPKDWGTRKVVPIMPSDVARWVRSAIREGWVPSGPGSQVYHRVTGPSVK